MNDGRISRGRLLRRAGLAAGAFAAAPLLAACGEVTTRSAAAVGTTEWWRGQHDTGRLVFANWPLYIDYTNWLKDRPSLNGFSRHTGIEVTYAEVIEAMSRSSRRSRRACRPGSRSATT